MYGSVHGSCGVIGTRMHFVGELYQRIRRGTQLTLSEYITTA